MKYVMIPIRVLMDILINTFFWCYYTVGFIAFLMPLYLSAYLLPINAGLIFQRLNYIFYRVFFFLSELIIPGLKIQIPDEIRNIKSSVIICNHIAYIDPILLISLYPKQKTIVKGSIFRMPLFGWFLEHSGYIPFTTEAADSEAMLKVIQNLEGFFADGGNLFVFPEGTRMPRGSIGTFQKGAFSLARRCKAPIEMLYITGTDRLMKPGHLWYSTCIRNEVTVERLGRIEPDYDAEDFSLKGLMVQVRERYVERTKLINS